jgi:hypothetical protein
MPPERPLIELVFYETYYFANVIKNILEGQLNYLRTLWGFFGDDAYLEFTSPFPKFSAFHRFIGFTISTVLTEGRDEIEIGDRQDEHKKHQQFKGALEFAPTKMPLNVAMDRFGVAHLGFEDWLKQHEKTFLDADHNDVREYYYDLQSEPEYERFLDKAVAEVFFVLFQNRHVLMAFNKMIASEVHRCADDGIDPDYADNFAKPGVLRRVASPDWVQRAVFFRDRGLCVLCHKNLTGIVNIWSQENFERHRGAPRVQGASIDAVDRVFSRCDRWSLRLTVKHPYPLLHWPALANEC